MTTELLSPKELAAHVGWPERRIRNLIAADQIRHIRIGGIIFSPKDAVDEYIKANMVEPSHAQAQEPTLADTPAVKPFPSQFSASADKPNVPDAINRLRKVAKRATK